MKRVLYSVWALGLLWMLLPLAALAANGDQCDANQFTPTAYGRMRPIWCVELIEDITSASGGPVNYDLTGTVAPGRKLGLPDAICFVVAETDATAGTISITSSQIVGGLRDNLPGSPAPTLDVDSSSPAGNTKICVNLHDAPLGEVLNASWTGVAGPPVLGFDIMAIGYEWVH